MTTDFRRSSTEPEALPPHNIEAEEAVLGSVLLDREVIGRVAPIIAFRDFYREKSGLVYQAMLDLYERGESVDYLTLITELDRTQRLAQAGGTTYVSGLLGVVPTPIHAERYAQIVADCAFMRRLVSAGVKIATVGFQNEANPEAALARCEQYLAETVGTRVTTRMIPIVAALSDYVDQMQALAEVEQSAETRTPYRLSTGFRDLDNLLRGGLYRGDLILLAGRPGMGKSALGFELLVRVARFAGARCVLFSLEMGLSQVLGRMLSATSGVPLARMDDGRLTPSQRVPFGKALGALAETAIMLDDTPRLSISTLQSRVRRLASERGGLDLVVVDHVQLLSGQSRHRVEEIGEISRGLKAIAREHNLVVIALAQLSRAVEQRTDKVPQLSDLRESGTLEQDADVVMMLYREDYYKQGGDRAGLADLLVPKHRNGRTGKLTLIWSGETTAFKGVEEFGL